MDEQAAIGLLLLQKFMPTRLAPGLKILHRVRVACQNPKKRTWRQGTDGLACPQHGQGAPQSLSIDFRYCFLHPTFSTDRGGRCALAWSMIVVLVLVVVAMIVAVAVIVAVIMIVAMPAAPEGPNVGFHLQGARLLKMQRERQAVTRCQRLAQAEKHDVQAAGLDRKSVV